MAPSRQKLRILSFALLLGLTAFAEAQSPFLLRVPPIEKLDDRYRLTLNATRDVPHTLLEKSTKKIWIRFVHGRSDGSQILQGDSVIQEIQVLQHHRAADLIMKMGADAVSSEVYFDAAKKKLMVDVFFSDRIKREFADQAAAAEKQAAAQQKETPVDTHAKKISSRRGKTAPPRVAASSSRAATAAAPNAVLAPAATSKPTAQLSAAPPKAVISKTGFTVVIDAGHGGMDAGAIGVRGTLEKDINLEVAKQLARALRKEKNVRVIMTRERDVFLPLGDRTRIANDESADLFVSVHCNSSLSAKNGGFEAYILAPSASDKAAEAVARIENSVVALEAKKGASTEDLRLNELLASMAVSNFVNESSKCSAFICRGLNSHGGIDDADVKEANFFVLRGADMPAVLLELDYLSNPLKEMKLRSSRYQSKLVKGVVDGIMRYAKSTHRGV